MCWFLLPFYLAEFFFWLLVFAVYIVWWTCYTVVLVVVLALRLLWRGLHHLR